MSDETDDEPGDVAGDTTGEVDEETVESERQERLDPDNRPDNAEVDNTQRTFDAETGMYTDSEGHDDAEPRFVEEEELSTGSEESERA